MFSEKNHALHSHSGRVSRGGRGGGAAAVQPGSRTQDLPNRTLYVGTWYAGTVRLGKPMAKWRSHNGDNIGTGFYL